VLDVGKSAQVRSDLRKQLHDGGGRHTVDAGEVNAGPVGQDLANIELRAQLAAGTMARMMAWPVAPITSVSTSVSWIFICTSAFCMRCTQPANSTHSLKRDAAHAARHCRRRFPDHAHVRARATATTTAATLAPLTCRSSRRCRSPCNANRFFANAGRRQGPGMLSRIAIRAVSGLRDSTVFPGLHGLVVATQAVPHLIAIAGGR